IRCFALSPDGTEIALCLRGGTVRIWNVSSGKGETRQLECYAVSVAFSTNGRIALGSVEGPITVWESSSGQKPKTIEGHKDYVTSVAFSSDGTLIVSGADDGTIGIWNVEKGRAVVMPFQGHEDKVKSVAFSPDGKYIVSGSEDGTVRVWCIADGKVVMDWLLEGHTDTVTSVEFSPDDDSIVSSSEDGTIRIWDAPDKKAI
ncbi:WD40 repeat-like protein, partial [Dendrothele bispora CBS 962.96]